MVAPSPVFVPVPVPSSVCANCARVIRADRDRVFCTSWCRDQAGLVRYTRRRLAQYGTTRVEDLPEDIGYAIRIRFAHVLAGGYDRQARTLTRQQRTYIMDRDHSRCVLCGNPGTEIDHIDGSSADLANLRLLCGPCHRDVTEARLAPLDPEIDFEAVALAAWLRARIGAEAPMLPCDSPDWDTRWRTWVSIHQA